VWHWRRGDDTVWQRRAPDALGEQDALLQARDFGLEILEELVLLLVVLPCVARVELRISGGLLDLHPQALPAIDPAISSSSSPSLGRSCND